MIRVFLFNIILFLGTFSSYSADPNPCDKYIQALIIIGETKTRRVFMNVARERGAVSELMRKINERLGRDPEAPIKISLEKEELTKDKTYEYSTIGTTWFQITLEDKQPILVGPREIDNATFEFKDKDRAKYQTLVIPNLYQNGLSVLINDSKIETRCEYVAREQGHVLDLMSKINLCLRRKHNALIQMFVDGKELLPNDFYDYGNMLSKKTISIFYPQDEKYARDSRSINIAVMLSYDCSNQPSILHGVLKQGTVADLNEHINTYFQRPYDATNIIIFLGRKLKEGDTYTLKNDETNIRLFLYAHESHRD